MTEGDFLDVVEVMKSLYPQTNISDNKTVFMFWFSQIGHMEKQDALNCIGEWAIENSRFAPSIGDFLKYHNKKNGPQMLDAMAAWGTVKKAVSNYGYDRQQQALESMDEITRSVVRDMGWYTICMSEMDDERIMFAQFRNTYEARAKIAERERIVTGQIGTMERKGIEG
jgi:hypothetical protein